MATDVGLSELEFRNFKTVGLPKGYALRRTSKRNSQRLPRPHRSHAVTGKRIPCVPNASERRAYVNKHRDKVRKLLGLGAANPIATQNRSNSTASKPPVKATKAIRRNHLTS